IGNSTTGNFRIRNSITLELLLINAKISKQIRVENSQLSWLSLEAHNEIAEGIVCEKCTIETFDWQQTKSLQVFIQRKSQIGTLQVNNVVFPKDAVLQINDSTLN